MEKPLVRLPHGFYIGIAIYGMSSSYLSTLLVVCCGSDGTFSGATLGWALIEILRKLGAYDLAGTVETFVE